MNKNISINQFVNFMGFPYTPDQKKTFKKVFYGEGEIKIGYSSKQYVDTIALIAVWNLLMREDTATVVLMPHGNRLDLVIFKKVQQYIDTIASGPLKSLVDDIRYDCMNTFNRGVSRLVFLDDSYVHNPIKISGITFDNLMVMALDMDNLDPKSIQALTELHKGDSHKIIMATPYLDVVDWDKAPAGAWAWERQPKNCIWHCRTQLAGSFTRKAPDFHVENNAYQRQSSAVA